MAAIEVSGTYNQGWVSYVIVALIYFPIQIVTEGLLSAFWESPKWLSKLIPAILILCFYGAVYALK